MSKRKNSPNRKENRANPPQENTGASRDMTTRKDEPTRGKSAPRLRNMTNSSDKNRFETGSGQKNKSGRQDMPKNQDKRALRRRKWSFLFALCVLAVLLWLGGELLIGLVFNLGLTASRIWAVLVLAATFAFSVWKCPR